MYHCHVRFYLPGVQREASEVIQELPPLESFTHSFTESRRLEAELLEQADVVIADLQSLPQFQETLPVLLESKRLDAHLILIADPAGLPDEALETACDIWPASMDAREVRYRFRRWQERLRQEKDLWQARHFLDATIDSVPNLIWYKDKDGVHEKVNDSFCRTVNKTREQVQGRRHAYIWDVEADDPACIESEAEVMQKRETCVSEEVVQTGEGERLLTTYKSPLYDLDGSVMGTVGVAIDITQERAYEQEIIKKTHTLETIFTTMDCGVMCHSLDGKHILSVNRAALEILGYESQEEMQKDGFQMVAASVLKEDKERLRAYIQSLDKVGDSVNVEYRVRHKDGRLLHVMGNIKLVQENGELFYQRFLLDITVQKQKETEERTESERRQMELVQALSIDYSLVCYFDLDSGIGRPLQVTDEGSGNLDDIFHGEIVLEESLGRYIERYVHPDDRAMLRRLTTREALRLEMTTRKTYYANYRVQVNGSVRYFQLKAVRTGDWSRQRAIVLGSRSVDEETRNEMEKTNLLEDALMQANRANKAKSVFLSNMSHDIRTPMNAIVGFTALALTHLERKEQVEEYLKKIMTSGNHLLSLINDILDMSRIESGKMHLDEKPCSLPEILHSLRNIIQADVRAKQLELYIDAVDVVHEQIFCDHLRLNQLLLNLLSNSIKYTPAGGLVTMRITEKCGAPVGFAAYEFTIKDTGIGMSQEFVSHIFEPFERERNSTISGIQGTGLGMAITKNIVDMMNGTISVSSEQGVGTEFSVQLAFRFQAGKQEDVRLTELKNCRALVVDDDFNTCDSVTCMLQQIGLRAEWTLSGKEAVLRTHQAVMRGDTYGVYIIDWLLPDMNGVEVARRIQKETGGQAPIIVITAYDWSDIEEEAREAGVSAFCSKPLFFSELRRCLQSVISGGAEQEIEEDPMHFHDPQHVHSGRILLAEDNELNQEIAVAVLEEAGFTTEIAENGQIALDMLQKAPEGHYQLILMDVQMPVLDGYTATKMIRNLEDPALANIPILAMTANAFEEDRQEAIRCGMNGHIAKPINIENLLETLDKVLGQH